MGLTEVSRNSYRPLWIVIFGFAVFSVLFSGIYIFGEHRNHLEAYQSIQNSEIQDAKQKSEEILKEIKTLLKSLETRIRAAEGNTKRIQTILSSANSLSSKYFFPPIQKLSYYKFSSQPAVINRFGVSPLDPKKMEEYSPQKAPSVHFRESSIQVTMQVFDNHADFEGILEIQIDLAGFQKCLGQFNTVFFSSDDLYTAEDCKHSEEFPQMSLKVPNKIWGVYFRK